MKKTLAAVAILGAFAGSAAADVTIYGRVDLGLAYAHDTAATTELDGFEMGSGQSTGSRWGLKGSEQISDSVKVGFQLESGFTADDGASAQGSTLFGREARLYVATDYGTFHFGQMGGLDSATGTLGITSGISVFGTGFGDSYGIADQKYVGARTGRMDNIIAYESPKMGGVTVYAMTSLATTEGAAEGDHEADRYHALGAKYQAGAFSAVVTASVTDYANVDFAAGEMVEDELVGYNSGEDKDQTYIYTAGATYNFGVAKVYGLANYYEQDGGDGYGLVFGADAPVAGGTLMATVGYGEYNADAANSDVERVMAAVAYKYPLSKKTYLYGAAGWNLSETDGKETENRTTVMAGIAHYF